MTQEISTAEGDASFLSADYSALLATAAQPSTAAQLKTVGSQLDFFQGKAQLWTSVIVSAVLFALSSFVVRVDH